MRRLLIVLFVGISNLSSIYAADNFESSFEAFIDDLFEQKEITWKNVHDEFMVYAHTIFKKSENSVDFCLLSRDKFKKFEKRKSNGKAFPELIAFEDKSTEILQNIEQYIFDIASIDADRSAYTEITTLSKLYLLSYEYGSNFISQSNILSVSTRCLDATSKILSTSLKEKLILIFMIKQIFTRNKIDRKDIIDGERNSIDVINCDFEIPDLSDDSEEETDTINKHVEPCFFGGEVALMRFIMTNLIYPQEAREFGIQGQIMVSFVVNGDGSLSDFCVHKSPPEILAKEALRILRKMPKWLPGSINGEPVRVRYHIPIRFTIA